MKTTPATATAIALLGILLSSCQEKENPVAAPPSDKATLQAVFVNSPPPDALQINEARKDPTPGRQITLSGEIMGNKHPLVDNRAILTLGDPTVITPCNRRPDDLCKTPWDVCCDDKDDIKRSIATIQVLDARGKVLKQGFRGINGIKELTYLTITGTIAEGSNPDNLLVNATAIHVAAESPYKDSPPVAAPTSGGCEGCKNCEEEESPPPAAPEQK